MKKTSLIILLFTLKAYSLECDYLPEITAKKVHKILEEHQRVNEIAVIDQFCKDCEDTYVKPIVIEEVKLKMVSQKESLYKINLNNIDLNLDHIYLEGESLAHKAGCKTKLSGQYLYEEKSATSSSISL